MNSMSYPPLMFFSTINNTSISVDMSNFIKTVCHTNPGTSENEQD